MLKPGMFIAERYEIIDTVGSGGMADVYKARCHKLNRFVAIKVLKEEFSSDDGFVDKFRAEAQSAAGLQHPNIVNIYDVGEENGMYYIVMELIEGITLKNFIERKGRLDVREATGIAIQIAQGLEAAHDNNIIHRDIKPQNIIISRDGKVKVADFGIAKAASSNTLTSSAMGSVHYISPEQARGGYSDEKSDIYSLGITMYEMILGKVPFEGDNAVSIALLHIQEEITPLGELVGDIPISTDKIVLKCLQKKPERRYLSVVELISDLKRSLVEPGVDFVVIPDVLNNSPTIALSPNDVNAIRNGAMQNPGPDMSQQMNPGMNQTMNPDMMNNGMYMNDAAMQGNNGNMNPRMDGNNGFPNYGGQQQFPGNGPDGYNDDFVDPDEEKVDDKLEKITKIGAVIIVIFIIAIILFFINQGGKDEPVEEPTPSVEPSITATFPTDDMAEVQSVEGKTLEEAERILKEQGFVVSIRKVAPPDESYNGLIKEQNPKAGTLWPLQTAVTLTVYEIGAEEEELEEEEKKMPDLTNMPIADAIKELNDLFEVYALQIEHKQVNHDTIPINAVVKTSPKAGDKIKNTDKVVITISIGKKNTVTVPQLFGLSSVDEAERKLESSGLKLGQVKEVSNDHYTNGMVVGQSQAANSEIERGSKIDIQINVVEEATEEPTPEPTEEVKEKDYSVAVVMKIAAEDVFEEHGGEPVKVTCTINYDGKSYTGSTRFRKDAGYAGEVEIFVKVRTKNDLQDGDIKPEDVSYSFENAKEGADSKAFTSGVAVAR